MLARIRKPRDGNIVRRETEDRRMTDDQHSEGMQQNEHTLDFPSDGRNDRPVAWILAWPVDEAHRRQGFHRCQRQVL